MSEYVSDCGSLDDFFDEASLALVEVEVHSPEPRVSNPDGVRTSPMFSLFLFVALMKA